jgi:predicted ATPase
MRGWLAAKDGNFDSGIKDMTYTVEQPFSAAFRPIYLSQLIEQEVNAGHTERAMRWVESGIEEIRTKGNWFCEPEFYRQRGEILLAQSRANAAEAERAIREALALAAKQSCRPLELRAAVSLARLLRDGARAAEARDLLAPVYAAFTEGFERPDLRVAKTLLAELS